MKKICLCYGERFYEYAKYIKKHLELMGYDVILNNSFQDSEKSIKEMRTNTIKNLQLSKECDSVLVLNLNVLKEGYNNIDNNTFLLMYNFYLENKDIFLYMNYHFNSLYKQIESMGPKTLRCNLFNIEDNYVKFENNNLLNYFTKKGLANIERIDDLYSRAFIIASEVFKDKKDKAGRPYFDHLFRVSLKLDENIEQVAALLHDIVEDTEITFKDLLEIGFPLEVVEIVKLVTKQKIDTSNMTKEEKLKLYSDEIDSIISSDNIHAIRLKKADMSDNYNKERLKELPLEKQYWFEEKYGKQLIKLRKVTEKERIL